MAKYLGPWHVTFAATLTVPCPTCEVPAGQECCYRLRSGYGAPMDRPHVARRKGVLIARDEARTRLRREVRVAQKDFEVREYMQLRAWLQAHGSIFDVAKLTKPSESVLPLEP